MISLPKFKILLGSEADGLTDEQIEQMRQDMYQLADMAFDNWVTDKEFIKKS